MSVHSFYISIYILYYCTYYFHNYYYYGLTALKQVILVLNSHDCNQRLRSLLIIALYFSVICHFVEGI